MPAVKSPTLQMAGIEAASSPYGTPRQWLRPGSIGVLLTLELWIYWKCFYSAFLYGGSQSLIIGPFLVHFGVNFLLGFIVFFALRTGEYLRFSADFAGRWPWKRYALAHLACFAALIVIGRPFAAAVEAGHPAALRECVVLILALGAAATAALLCAPLRSWLGFLSAQRRTLFIIAAGAALYAAFKMALPSFDSQLFNALFKPTVFLAGWVDGLFGYQVTSDAAAKTFGTASFDAEVAPGCLGFQGATLISLFLGGYIYCFRQQLRFPNVLIVLPLAVLAMWLLNVLRIAVLIAIGTSVSVNVAVGGFHSVAGWILFLATATLSIYAIRRSPWFAARPGGVGLSVSGDNLLLVPELVLIGTSLATLLVTGTFDWPYPVRVLTVGAVLVSCRGRFGLGRLRFDLGAIGIGIAVFALWLALIPAAPAKAALFSRALFAAPEIVVFSWIALRCIGAVIIVPLAEEMAFRGFLFPFIENQCGLRFGARGNRLLALLGSSLIFGILHDAWLAGILAGIGYGLAKLRRGRLMDAVIAHATTNLLLAVYVLVFRQWSFW